MLGHHDVSDYNEVATLAHLFKYFHEEVAAACASEERQPLVTACCNEVQVAVAVKALQASGHLTMLVGVCLCVCDE